MPTIGSRLASPMIVVALVPVLLAGLLSVGLTVPVGPFYWDLYVYLDAANRIADGQVPSVDFFTPVGPLGYWLFAGLANLFPSGQPLLVVQWSLLAVTLPLLAPVLVEVGRQSRPTAFALLVPFLVFSLLPFNVEEYYPYPGVDGYGIYNRQVCQILYVLAAALVFVRRQGPLTAVIAGAMLALFLVKITGFIAGLMLAAIAFSAGRIALRSAVGAILVFAAVLSILEVWLGVTSAYLGDIVTLVSMNEGVILSRFLQAGSLHFIAIAPLAALTLTLLAFDARGLLEAAGKALRHPRLAAVATLFDRDVVWVGGASFAGLFFETQNTGGQAFIFLWPILLQVIWRSGRWSGASLALVLALVAASVLPTFMEVIHRSARATVGQILYERLDHTHLGVMGAVTQRGEVMTRARTMIETYRRFPEAYQFLADSHQLPTFTLYAEPDFQLTWLMTADEAVSAILAYEATNGVRFGTIMNLNFINPFPWLLDRSAPHAIAIGADPFRAVPNPDATVIAAVEESDLVLYPRCPVTNANQALLKLYTPGLGKHTRISLSPCWDAFVRTVPAPAG